MEVLIVSKTRMNMGVCVGGITLDGRFVRLLDEGGQNQPNNCPFEINQIYEITFKERRNLIAPHTEDILLQSSKYIRRLKDKIRMIDFITNMNVDICRGNISHLFDKCLGFTASGSGYINSSMVPRNSVSFWIADKDLTKSIDENGKIRYKYEMDDSCSSDIQIKYVGLQHTENIIPKGTLLRVSLARWWRPHDADVEHRCYLQLSGWYK